MKRWAMIFLVLVFPALASESKAQTFDVVHDHFWGSCKGTLTFTAATVEYTTKKKDHSRSWKYVDIQQLANCPRPNYSPWISLQKSGFWRGSTF